MTLLAIAIFTGLTYLSHPAGSRDQGAPLPLVPRAPDRLLSPPFGLSTYSRKGCQVQILKLVSEKKPWPTRPPHPTRLKQRYISRRSLRRAVRCARQTAGWGTVVPRSQETTSRRFPRCGRSSSVRTARVWPPSSILPSPLQRKRLVCDPES